MTLQKITHFLAQKAMGKDLALAILLLKAITAALQNKNVSDIARFVYAKLPDNWRANKSATAGTEFVDMIQAGQLFLTKVQAVLKP